LRKHKRGVILKNLFYLITLSILLFGCNANKLTKDMSVERKMEIGDKYFQKGKHNKAIPFYTDVVFERNSIYTAEAQIKLADCYFHLNKFMEARFEYEEVIRLFPDYENVNKAFFQTAVCYFEESLPSNYTQEETKKAIISFEIFIEKFPFDEKKKEAFEYIQKCHYSLLEKKYNNGYVYFKMYDYSAALIYFDEIIELGNINEIDKLSLYYSIKIFQKRENLKKVAEFTAKLINKYPDSKEAEKLTDISK